MEGDGKLSDYDVPQFAIAILATCFTIAYLSFFYYYQDAAEIADAELNGYLEVLLLGLPILVLFGCALWLGETDFDLDLRSRIVWWTLAVGGFFLVAITTTLFVLEPQYDRGERHLMLQMSAGFGVAAGAIMGSIEARAIQYYRERERSSVEHRRREHEKRRLEYLNQYLRHEVLNESNKITGYADMLRSKRALDEEAESWARVIQDSGREITEFIQAIRTVMTANDGDPEVHPVAVTDLVEDTVEQVRRAHPDVRITVDREPGATAYAGELLDRVLTNLLENAIQHNEDVSVSVEIATTTDAVTVCVRDDGDGLTEGARATLFEPPTAGDHGYGLYLARHLVELYGGRLELARSDSNGTAFSIRLEKTPNSSVTSPQTTSEAKQLA